MPTKAYILIETQVGKAAPVVRALQELDVVQSADGVTGPYDIIAIVEADDLGSIGDLINDQIHTIPGITRSVTCLRMA